MFDREWSRYRFFIQSNDIKTKFVDVHPGPLNQRMQPHPDSVQDQEKDKAHGGHSVSAVHEGVAQAEGTCRQVLSGQNLN